MIGLQFYPEEFFPFLRTIVLADNGKEIRIIKAKIPEEDVSLDIRDIGLWVLFVKSKNESWLGKIPVQITIDELV